MVLILPKVEADGFQMVVRTFLKIDLYCKPVQSIDRVLSARTISIRTMLMDIEHASIMVTVGVVLVVWCITSVNGSVPGIHVGLHDVQFRAEVLRQGRGIAVVCAVWSLLRVAVLVITRLGHKSHGSVATTLRLRKINIVANRAAKYGWLVEAFRLIASIAVFLTKLHSNVVIGGESI